MAQINKPDTYFNTVLYTGNFSTQSITGVGFQPDLCWIKNRDLATFTTVLDSVRGLKFLYTPDSGAEGDFSSNFTSFDSDGFSVGANNNVNGSGNGIVSWNWLASNTTASNTDGSITSTVSANTTSGFSIVSFTSTGSTSTVGHGLGVTPDVYIIKNRSAVEPWFVYTTKIDGSLDYLILNQTNSKVDFGLSAPTSSVFSTDNGSNGNSIIAYCFAEKKGFSKFGSYTGNGSADGTFVYTGFKPAMIITKQTNVSGGQWYIYDSVRNEFNLTDKQLFPNLSNAESTGNNQYDFYSNGFKARSSNGDTNASGGSYIYMAFAESPLVGTNNIPAVAR